MTTTQPPACGKISELAPCPFCGAPAKLNRISGSYGYYSPAVQYQCSKCFCAAPAESTEEWQQGRGTFSVEAQALEKAAAAWSLRHPAPVADMSGGNPNKCRFCGWFAGSHSPGCIAPAPVADELADINDLLNDHQHAVRAYDSDRNKYTLEALNEARTAIVGCVAPPPSSSPSATADATLRAALEKDALMTKAEHLLRGWRRTFEEGRHGNSPINSTREWLSRFDAALAGNEGEKL